MTEARIRDLLTAAEAARDAAPEEAAELGELAATIAAAHDALAEVMMDARVQRGPDQVIAAVRLQLDGARVKAERLANARAQSIEAWARLVGPPASSPAATDELADTRPMALDEIAELGSKDSR